MDYEKELEIDKFALDNEWVNQPQVFMRVCTLQAEARKKQAEAKENLDVVRAKLDRDIRTNPASYGLEKITEGAIQSIILLNGGYAAAHAACIQADYEADMLTGAVRAFDQRKDALENLVRLQAQEYFSAPRTEAASDQEREAGASFRQGAKVLTRQAVKDKIKNSVKKD